MSFVNQYRSTTIYGELKVQKYNTGNIAGLLDVSGTALFRGDLGVNGNIYATDGTVDVSGNLNVTDTISGKLAINDTNNTNDFFRVPFLDSQSSSSTLSSSAGLQYNPVSEYVNYTTLNGGDIYALDISCNNVNANNLTGNISISTDNTNASFFPIFVSGNTGNLPLKVDSGITYNPSTETLNVTNINGTITNNSATSTIATDSSNQSFFPTFVSGTSGNLPLKVDAGITYNPSTNILSCDVSGNLTGNVTGNLTGTATKVRVVDTTTTLNDNYCIPYSQVPSDAFITTDSLLGIDPTFNFNPSTNTLTVTNITGTSSSVNFTDAAQEDTSFYVPFASNATGSATLKTDAGFRFNPFNNNLTAVATNVNVTQVGSATAYRVPFLSSPTGSATISSDAELTYNPSTNTLVATNITGTVSNVNVTSNTDNVSYRLPFLSASTGSATILSDGGITYNPSSNLLTTTVTNVNVAASTADTFFRVPFLSAATGSAAITTDPTFEYNPTGNYLEVSRVISRWVGGVWLIGGTNTGTIDFVVPIFTSQSSLTDLNDQGSLTYTRQNTSVGTDAQKGTFQNPIDVGDKVDRVIVFPRWGVIGYRDGQFTAPVQLNFKNLYDFPITIVPAGDANQLSSIRVYLDDVEQLG